MPEDDYAVSPATHVSLSPSTGAGVAALLIGCTLLISSCALMVFNVLLFMRGLRGIPMDAAEVGGVVGVIGVAALGIVAVVFGIRSWSSAARSGESAALGVAATAAAVVGLVAWLIAGIDLLAILGLFA